MKIEISDWHRYIKNTLQGFFTATLPSGLVLHKLTLHKKGEQTWIGLPSEKYTKRDGNVGYAALVEFRDRETADRFRDEVIAALKDEGIL